jgi:hypothetical protein
MHGSANEETKKGSYQCQSGRPINDEPFCWTLLIKDGSKAVSDACAPYQAQHASPNTASDATNKETTETHSNGPKNASHIGTHRPLPPPVAEEFSAGQVTASFFLHACYATFEMFVHFFGGAVVNAAVARQNPFEAKREQLLHRARLFLPGIPADIAEGRQGFTRWRPCQVVARE